MTLSFPPCVEFHIASPIPRERVALRQDEPASRDNIALRQDEPASRDNIALRQDEPASRDNIALRQDEQVLRDRATSGLLNRGHSGSSINGKEMRSHHHSDKAKHVTPWLLFMVLILVIAAFPMYAQAMSGDGYSQNSARDTLRLTLDDAVRIALENNFGMENVRIDREIALQQVREAWGNVYPRVNATGNYTRNLVTANPFAGSGAQDLFAGFGAIGWLRYNEEARLEGNPELTFEEYIERQMEGYEEAGITPPSLDDDPFSVDNQFFLSLSITQTLFNGSAFAAIQGAEQFKNLSEDAVQRERQVVIDEVRRAFFSVLLAWQQVDVLRKSVERLRSTVADVSKTVEQGLESRFAKLSAEVELVNLETELIEAENRAELAGRNINLLLNMDASRPVRLVGDLAMTAMQPVGDLALDEAVAIARSNRPDIRQAQGMIEINKINERINRSSYRPIVNAFANFDYIGRVPDNRTVIGPDPADPDNPFRFDSQTRGFFHDSYWNPNVSVGINVSWNIFSGFQNRARLEQTRIETRRSSIRHEMLTNAVHVEVDQALRSLRTAERRIESQMRNIEQAQVNYNFAKTRLSEGVGNRLEERQASMLLDQSRLAYLAAIHDYLHAVSRFELALGTSIDRIQTGNF